MIAVIINEKGGGERREVFQKAEITLGRLQGNDLVLAKGNVSKQHARVLFQDGCFLVTDQNSTNGTYVNRKRITEPTVVRAGDRIYVGDYVLRVEEEGAAEQHGPKPEAAPESPLDAPLPALDPLSTPFVAPVLADVPAAPRLPGDSALVAAAAAAAAAEADADPASIPLLTDHEALKVSDKPNLVALLDTVRRVVEATHARFSPDRLRPELEPSLKAEVETFAQGQINALEPEAVAVAGGLPLVERSVRSELFELGPLGSVLADPTVVEVAIDGAGSHWVTRVGLTAHKELPFSSEASLECALHRLCRFNGIVIPPEGSLRCILSNGFRLNAVRSQHGRWVLALARLARVHASLDGLVRRGTLSRVMATFLRHCAEGKINVWVVGERSSGTSDVLSALAHGAPNDSWIALSERDHFLTEQGHLIGVNPADFSGQAAPLIALAETLSGARLLLDGFHGERAALVLDAIAAGAQGAVVATPSPSIDLALVRIPASVVAAGRGYDLGAAREALVGAFDVALEVARLPDGRDRIMRICELRRSLSGGAEPVDLFRFTIERTASGGSVEGVFSAVGVEPHFVQELRDRGMQIDGALFR